MLGPALALLLTSACGSRADAQSIRIDHRTVDASVLPQTALDAARAMRMSFSHASVGANIWWDGLDPLARRDPRRYAFPNWRENERGNPGWRGKFDLYTRFVEAHASEYDVFMDKLCFIDQGASFPAYRDSMLALARRHPGKVFVWWTMPIMVRAADNAERAAYNREVRAYTAAHDLPLFDIAAIESHHADGSAVTVDGVESLAPEYASDNGHLNGVGAARAANAFWVLMARLSGWNPQGATPAAPARNATPARRGRAPRGR